MIRSIINITIFIGIVTIFSFAVTQFAKTNDEFQIILSSMENLESYARERFELARQKQTLKEQQQQRLTVTYNGGLFRVDMTLLNYLYMKNDFLTDH